MKALKTWEILRDFWFFPSGFISEIPLPLLVPGFPGIYSFPSYLGNRVEISLPFLTLSEVALPPKARRLLKELVWVKGFSKVDDWVQT